MNQRSCTSSSSGDGRCIVFTRNASSVCAFGGKLQKKSDRVGFGNFVCLYGGEKKRSECAQIGPSRFLLSDGSLDSRLQEVMQQQF